MGVCERSEKAAGRLVAVAGEGVFSQRWRDFLPSLGFEVRCVDLYSPSLMADLDGCFVLLASLSQDLPRDMKFGRAILDAVAMSGVAVYPNAASAWHFEDKIAQALIFKAMNLACPRTWAFFDFNDARRFISDAEFPLVFKLRSGAGGLNVHLVESRRHAMRLVDQMFGRGIRTHGVVVGIRRLAAAAKNKPFQLRELLPRAKRAGRRFLQSRFGLPREQGYALFQGYVSGCDYSIRIAVIGDRAFAYRRNNEKGDFKSGIRSVRVSLSREEIPLAMVEMAFEVSGRLRCQSMGYDFLQPPDGSAPILLEMCHTFPPDPIVGAHGYFTRSLTWVPDGRHPADLIALDLLTAATEVLGPRQADVS